MYLRIISHNVALPDDLLLVYAAQSLKTRWPECVEMSAAFADAKTAGTPEKVTLSLVKHSFNNYGLAIQDRRTEPAQFYYVSMTETHPEWASRYTFIRCIDVMAEQIGLSIMHVADLILQDLKLRRPLSVTRYSALGLTEDIHFYLGQAVQTYEPAASEYYVVSPDVVVPNFTVAYTPKRYALSLLGMFHDEGFEMIASSPEHWRPVLSVFKEHASPYSVADAAELIRSAIRHQAEKYVKEQEDERVSCIANIMLDSLTSTAWQKVWTPLRQLEQLEAIAELERVRHHPWEEGQQDSKVEALVAASEKLRKIAESKESKESMDLIALSRQCLVAFGGEDGFKLQALRARLRRERQSARCERRIDPEADVVSLNEKVMTYLKSCESDVRCQFIFILFRQEWEQLQSLPNTLKSKLWQGQKLVQAMGASVPLSHILYAGTRPVRAESLATTTSDDAASTVLRRESEEIIPAPMPFKYAYLIEFFNKLRETGVRVDASKISDGTKQLEYLERYGALKAEDPRDLMAKVAIFRKLILQAWLDHYYHFAEEHEILLQGLSVRALDELIHFMQARPRGGAYEELGAHSPQLPMIQALQGPLVEQATQLLSITVEQGPHYQAMCIQKIQEWLLHNAGDPLAAFAMSTFAQYLQLKDEGSEYSVSLKVKQDWFMAFLHMTEDRAEADPAVLKYHSLQCEVKKMLDLSRLSIIWSYQIHDVLSQILAFMIKRTYLDNDLAIPHALALEASDCMEIDYVERTATALLAADDSRKNLIAILVTVSRILSMEGPQLEAFVTGLREQLRHINWRLLEGSGFLTDEALPRLTRDERGLNAMCFCAQRFAVIPAPDVDALIASATPLRAGAGTGAGAGVVGVRAPVTVRHDANAHIKALIALNMDYLFDEIASLSILEASLIAYRRSKEAMVPSFVINHFLACLPVNRWYHRLYSVLSTSYGIMTMLEERVMESGLKDLIVFSKNRIWTLAERLQRYQDRLIGEAPPAFLTDDLRRAALDQSTLVRLSDVISSIVKLKSTKSYFTTQTAAEIQDLFSRQAIAAGMRMAPTVDKPWYARLCCWSDSPSVRPEGVEMTGV